jgi:hypothetical protein
MYALAAITRNQRLAFHFVETPSSMIASAVRSPFELYLRSVRPYFAHMSLSGVALLTSIIVSATASNTPSAEPNWVGDYADKKFLNGQAVFQMSIKESGNAIQVSFDAAYNDAHGAAPDGEGQAKINGKNTLEFKWKDSFKNSGTGRITRAGEDIIVSMKTTRVVDSRCLVFYGQKTRLKRVKQ